MPKLSKKQIFFSLFCLASFLCLVALGVWQLERLKWKKSRIEYINLQLSLPAISFPISSDDINDVDNEYRLIHLYGTLMNTQDMYVGPKYFDSVPGFHLITPMMMFDGTIVLVNRGWVPTLKKYEDIGSVYRPSEIVSLIGMMRKGDKSGAFTPDNDPTQGLWYWTDLKSMVESVRQLNQENITRPVLVEVIEEEKTEKYPAPFSKQITIRNDHLGYAITWFSLAFVVLVMYMVHFRSEITSRRKEK